MRAGAIRLSYWFLLTILLLSCKGKQDTHNRQVFRYNESAGITSLDPAFAKDQANIWACNQLFNSLVQLDSQLQIQPCLATNWDISADGKVYRFYLRNDVFFHETDFFRFPQKRKMTAKDVVYSFNRILDPKVASPGAWLFSMVDSIKGKPAFLAINDTLVEIHLKKPFSPFLGLLSMQYCS
ncbi:MAG: hypothetical protein J5606_07770, partial [Bacteroidales bacterium]|nr:hypothetical protein [Bacteroidales bacterium]